VYFQSDSAQELEPINVTSIAQGWNCRCSEKLKGKVHDKDRPFHVRTLKRNFKCACQVLH